MKKTLMNPPADARPMPEKPITAKEILDLDYEKALTAFADYDGPVRSLLNRIIQCRGDQSLLRDLLNDWVAEAKALMNVIYKVNGLKDRWTE